MKSAVIDAGFKVARGIVDLALPPRCPACGAIVAEDHRFCTDCWASMDFLAGPCCAQCGAPFPFDQGEGALCGGCLADPPAFDRARAAIAYGDVARGVAMKLKYGRKTGLARLIAGQLLRHLPDGAEANGRADMLLAPVPLHRWRIWSRGYNQSALIADALGRASGIARDHQLLLRIKATPPLRGMGPAARAKVVRGAFALSPGARDRIAGRTVLLIDDVLTSGATANACAKMLKRGGAREVHLLCWARVLPDRDDAQSTAG